MEEMADPPQPKKKPVNLHGLLLNVKNWGCIGRGSRSQENPLIDLVSKRIYLGNRQQMDQ